jgi:hypothetical protein
VFPTDGDTIRGCLSTLPIQLKNSSSLCTQSGCNNKIYPENRRQCYQCTNNDDICLDEPQSFSCLAFVLDDSCYTTFDGSVITRGCSSDFPQNFNICDDQNLYCRICANDACNGEIDDTFRDNLGTSLARTLVNTQAIIVSIWITMFSHSHLSHE